MRTEIECLGGPHDGEQRIVPTGTPTIDLIHVPDPLISFSDTAPNDYPQMDKVRYRLLYDQWGHPVKTRDGRLCYVPVRG
jgi:hypothetical protein